MSQDVATTDAAKKQVREWTPNEQTSLPFIKGFLKKSDIEERIKTTLGENAGAFASSLVTLVSNDSKLQKCNPASIMSSAFCAAACKLSLEKSLGLAYIVPYGQEAQFQIGVRGLYQLAMRSGQYVNINYAEIYDGELIGENRVTGSFEFDFSKRKSDKIIGYTAYLKMVNGFEKTVYWSHEKVMAHAQRYSKAFKYGPWQTNQTEMCLKTVLKYTLLHFGVLSVELQNAIKEDQTVDGEYADNPHRHGPSGEEPVIPASVRSSLGETVDAVVVGEKAQLEAMSTEELAKRADAAKGKDRVVGMPHEQEQY